MSVWILTVLLFKCMYAEQVSVISDQLGCIGVLLGLILNTLYVCFPI